MKTCTKSFVNLQAYLIVLLLIVSQCLFGSFNLITCSLLLIVLQVKHDLRTQDTDRPGFSATPHAYKTQISRRPYHPLSPYGTSTTLNPKPLPTVHRPSCKGQRPGDKLLAPAVLCCLRPVLPSQRPLALCYRVSSKPPAVNPTEDVRELVAQIPLLPLAWPDEATSQNNASLSAMTAT